MTFELWLRKFHADDRADTFTGIFALEILIGILNEFVLTGIVVNDLSKSTLKACKVGSALDGGDVIRIGVDVLCERIIILDRYLNEALSASLGNVDRRLMKGLSVAVQILNEGDDTTIVMQDLIDRLFGTVIAQNNRDFSI